jgi:PEP-CTERM motif-containing protein
MARHFLFAACLISALVAPTAARSAFEAAADFSPTSNPNGVWGYGWTQTLGSSFIPDAIHQNVSGLDFWEGSIAQGSPPGSFPLVFHNGTANTIVTAGTVSVPPGQLGLHPGPGGQDSVLRWTAPGNDAVSIKSLFSGLDFAGPTSTDVHVLHNQSSLFDGVVEGFGSSSAETFSTMLTVARGDTIDFVVGLGRNANFFNDSTGLSATIASVPEPAALALFGVGILGLLGYGVRRQKLAA